MGTFVDIFLSDYVPEQPLPVGTMPSCYTICMANPMEILACCKAPDGFLFEQYAEATPENVNIRTPFRSFRAWADLLAPPLIYFHHALLLRCAAAVDAATKRMIVIIGHSGAGKSVTLKNICNYDPSFSPVADDHLGMLFTKFGCSVFTPLWDEFGKDCQVFSDINDILMIVLDSQVVMSKGELFKFILGQSLCVTLHPILSMQVISSLECLLHISRIEFMQEMRPSIAQEQLMTIYSRMVRHV